MNQRSNKIFFWSISCILGLLAPGCTLEEKAYDPLTFDDTRTIQTINMGPNYDQQFFYDLGTDAVVSSNHREAWDIAISTEAPYKLIMNSSKLMSAAVTNETSVTSQVDVASLDAWPDHQGLELDSLVMKDWQNGLVYYIDRGSDNNLSSLGEVLAKFELINDRQVLINHATLGQPDETDTLNLDNTYSYAYFSFDNGGEQVNIEPAKESWDLLFTQYTYMFYLESEGKTPYSVNGLLLNPYNVTATMDTSIGFDSLIADDIAILDFTTQRDIIGYEWKYYDFDAGTYTAVEGMSFVIEDAEEHYYKIQFVGFENDQGVKGYPTFYRQQLQ